MTTYWQPIETCPDEGLVLVMDNRRNGDPMVAPWHGPPAPSPKIATHWAPMPEMPEPDPMTVVGWHPMEKLPRSGLGVLVSASMPHGGRAVFTRACPENVRALDMDRHDLVAWCPLAPLLDLIDKAGES